MKWGRVAQKLIYRGLTTMGYTFSKIIVKSKGGESRAGAVAT